MMSADSLNDFLQQWKQELISNTNESQNNHEKDTSSSQHAERHINVDVDELHEVVEHDDEGKRVFPRNKKRKHCLMLPHGGIPQSDGEKIEVDKPSPISGELLSTPVKHSSLKTHFQLPVASTTKAHLKYNKHLNKESNQETSIQKERYLDTFLADLDEINEIPFFDLTVPREVAMNIFQHFDIKDLCRCAQVSKSWKSLAEDELLWCNLCHKLGYELQSLTASRHQWKRRTREHYVREKTLIHNWNNRIGRYQEVTYVQGGILCAADSRDTLVAAGYTNGDISVWNMETVLSQVYRPSSISLMIDEAAESGTLTNHVASVKLGNKMAAALYSQGILDVWCLDGNVEPVYTCRSLCTCSRLHCHHDKPLVAVSFDRQVRMLTMTDDGGINLLGSIDFGQNVQWLKFVPSSQQDSVCVQTGSVVRLVTPGQPRAAIPVLHELADSFISCIDITMDQLAVAVTSYGLLDGSKVQVYKVDTGRLVTSLGGFHGMDLKCMNAEDSPDNMIITGGADRRVYVHDMRINDPVTCLSPGVSVSLVQMDDIKAVINSHDGHTCVYDLRTCHKLWEFHNRHPVVYSRFSKYHLVTANVPQCKYMDDRSDTTDHMTHKRYRGGVHVYDFTVTNDTEGIPDICSSNYHSHTGYSYNINLTMPYDRL